MKALIAHHLARARTGIEYNALRHCHVKNVYSIVLHDEPGNRVRMFFAGPLHELWRNVPDCVGNSDTLAVHPRHCDVRLVKLFGDVTNYRMGIVPRSEGAWHEFKYVSAITTNGPGSLTATGRRAELLVVARLIAAQFQFLSTHELFRVDISGDHLWQSYLDAFPPGTNPIYRVRTEHDGSYDRNFVRRFGNVVAIVNGKIQTIWDIQTDDEAYREVCATMAAIVRDGPIVSVFREWEQKLGRVSSTEKLDSGHVHTWHHFHAEVAKKHLDKHRKVFELVGAKTKVAPSDDQLSGLGFSSTKPAVVTVRLEHKRGRPLFNIHF